MKRPEQGFTLIELMIVVGIIGTLASLAVPAYQSYVARSQVAEAVHLVGAARTAITEYYANNGAWPDSLELVAGGARGRYTAGVTLAAGGGSPEPAATLRVTMRDSGVQRDIQGKTLLLSTDNGGSTWTCRPGDIDTQYLPGACR